MNRKFNFRITLQLVGLVVFIGCLASSCKKTEVDPPLTPIKLIDLVGTWQLTTARTVIRGVVAGKPQTIDQTRTGTADNTLLFLNDGGVAADKSDLFGTGTYGWRVYLTNGNDLTMRKGSQAKDYGYFTVRINGNTMIWTMSKEQAIKSSADSNGYSSVLNGGTDVFDSLDEFSLRLEFVKR